MNWRTPTAQTIREAICFRCGQQRFGWDSPCHCGWTASGLPPVTTHHRSEHTMTDWNASQLITTTNSYTDDQPEAPGVIVAMMGLDGEWHQVRLTMGAAHDLAGQLHLLTRDHFGESHA